MIFRIWWSSRPQHNVPTLSLQRDWMKGEDIRQMRVKSPSITSLPYLYNKTEWKEKILGEWEHKVCNQRLYPILATRLNERRRHRMNGSTKSITNVSTHYPILATRLNRRRHWVNGCAKSVNNVSTLSLQRDWMKGEDIKQMGAKIPSIMSLLYLCNKIEWKEKILGVWMCKVCH